MEELNQKSISCDVLDMSDFKIFTIVNGTNRWCEFSPIPDLKQSTILPKTLGFLRTQVTPDHIYVIHDLAAYFGKEFKNMVRLENLTAVAVPTEKHSLLLAESYNKIFGTIFRRVTYNIPKETTLRFLPELSNLLSLLVNAIPHGDQKKSAYETRYGKILDFTKLPQFLQRVYVPLFNNNTYQMRSTEALFLGPHSDFVLNGIYVIPLLTSTDRRTIMSRHINDIKFYPEPTAATHIQVIAPLTLETDAAPLIAKV